jgi:hypothetical protein
MPGRRHGHEFPRSHAARALQMLLTVTRSASQSVAFIAEELRNDQLDADFLRDILGLLLPCCHDRKMRPLSRKALYAELKTIRGRRACALSLNGLGMPRLATGLLTGGAAKTRAFLPVHLQHICTNDTMPPRMSIAVRSELRMSNVALWGAVQ